MTEKEECDACGLIHEKVECIGIFHCPNALCKGCGGAWFRKGLDSYNDNDDGTHTVDEDEWLSKGILCNALNGIKTPEKSIKFLTEVKIKNERQD